MKILRRILVQKFVLLSKSKYSVWESEGPLALTLFILEKEGLGCEEDGKVTVHV